MPNGKEKQINFAKLAEILGDVGGAAKRDIGRTGERLGKHGILPGLLLETGGVAQGLQGLTPKTLEVIAALMNRPTQELMGQDLTQAMLGWPQPAMQPNRPDVSLGAGALPEMGPQQAPPVPQIGSDLAMQSQVLGQMPEVPNIAAMMPPELTQRVAPPEMAPTVTPPDFAAALAAIQELKPEAVDTPGKLEKLAMVLGGAASGAAQGLQTPYTSAVIAGAGGGAVAGMARMNQDTRDRQERFQNQQQIYLRTKVGVMAQEQIARQQARSTTAALASRAEGQRISAEGANLQADVQRAAMGQRQELAQIQLQWERDKMEYEAKKPEFMRGATGLLVKTVDENGQIRLSDTPDSVFMKLMMEMERLAEMAEAAGMGQEAILLGFEEITLEALAPEERPLAIMAAMALHNPGPSTFDDGSTIVTQAQIRLLQRVPEMETLWAVVSTGRATRDQTDEWQKLLWQELMTMMSEPQGGDQLYQWMLQIYGGAGLSAGQQGTLSQSLAPQAGL